MYVFSQQAERQSIRQLVDAIINKHSLKMADYRCCIIQQG
jgi:hypothetical protein